MSENDITVGICTFRRPSLESTLQSLARQKLTDQITINVVVADNDNFENRRSQIEQLGLELGLKLTYVHAPACNISIARNACLDTAKTRWLAFIDDDEVADSYWLEHLLKGRRQGNFSFGPCQAIYSNDTPTWIKDADIHSNRIANKGACWNGYTSNVLIDLDFVKKHKLRFDVLYGQTGGEDTLFFSKADLLGAHFSYLPDALVFEPIAPNRATFRWALKRKFRSGQVHFVVLKQRGSHIPGVLLAFLKAFACLATAPIIGKRWREAILRGALHLGVISRAFGAPVYVEYADAPKKT